eukprot:3062011-Pyramimonas_sp.AAC.1
MYRKEAAARRALVTEPPIQTQVNLALSKLRVSEKKLQSAVTRLEEQQKTMIKQRGVVVELRAELGAADDSQAVGCQVISE